MQWFTSDLHLNHNGILKHRERFSSIEEMDGVILENINSKVGKNDDLYILGDVVIAYKNDIIASYFPRFHCDRIHIILGNHDHNLKKYKDYFLATNSDLVRIDKMHCCRHEKQRIVLCHYAMRTWNNMHHGAWHLYGHSHGSLAEENTFSFDCGIDTHNFFPYSWNEVAERMSGKTFKIIDHHGS